MIRLKELRNNVGMTQAEVALQLNISVQSYCNYEKGQRSPNPNMLISIADYFNVSIDYLLGHDTKKSPTAETVRLSDEHKALIYFWDNLDPANRKYIANMIARMFPSAAFPKESQNITKLLSSM